MRQKSVVYFYPCIYRSYHFNILSFKSKGLIRSKKEKFVSGGVIFLSFLPILVMLTDFSSKKPKTSIDICAKEKYNRVLCAVEIQTHKKGFNV